MSDKEYIERGALIEMLNNKAKTDHEMGLYNHGALTESFIRFVERQPAADVVEVRHGYWTLNKDGSGTCDQCGMTQKGVWDYDNWQNYCGCCGAKMYGERKEQT